MGGDSEILLPLIIVDVELIAQALVVDAITVVDRELKTVVELIDEEAVEEFISPVEYNDEKSVIILDVVVV